MPKPGKPRFDSFALVIQRMKKNAGPVSTTTLIRKCAEEGRCFDHPNHELPCARCA